MKKAAVAVLVSGGGTNLQALIDAQNSGIIKSGEIKLVVSSCADAFALKRAEKAGIKCAVCERSKLTKAEFENAILKSLYENEIDIIVLAGFMCILSEDFVRRFPQRIINVHPSLIPSFCGKGFYGLHVHEKVLERGVKVTGATVHFVDEDLDHGKILLQKAVEIPDGITPEELQQKVMKEAEWIILPKAIDMIADGQIPIGE